MKKFFFTCLLVPLFNCVSNAQSQDTIYWSPCYKLKWQDFQGKVKINADYFAITESGIKYSYQFNDSNFSYKVTAFFEKRKSSKIEQVNDYILNHEQIHFDISEIFARKLRAEFSMLSVKRETVKSDIKNIIVKILHEKDELQNQYDEETDFSNEINKQAYWNNKVRLLLKDLDLYK